MLKYCFSVIFVVVVEVFSNRSSSAAELLEVNKAIFYCNVSNVFMGDYTFDITLSDVRNQLIEGWMLEGSSLQKVEDFKALQQAKFKFEKVIQVTQEAGENILQARAWSQLGDVLLALNDPQGALVAYERILSLLLFPDNYDYVGKKVEALSKIGRVYRALGKRQQAVDIYGQALVLTDRDGDAENRCLRRAKVLHSIGEIYVEMDELNKASYYFDKSLDLRWMLIPDLIDFDPVDIVNNQGKIYFSEDILKSLGLFDWSFQRANRLSESIDKELLVWDLNSGSREYGLDQILRKINLGVQQSTKTIYVLNQLYSRIKNLDETVLCLRRIKQYEALKSKLKAQLELIDQRRKQLK